MSCRHCEKAALAKSKFCRHCGEPVSTPCPACNAANPLDSRFCGECGHNMHTVLAAKGARSQRYTEAEKTSFVSQGERRHLTILFTDLTGYTRIMERYDPEDVQALMATIIDRSIQIIEGYKGHVERIIGDEVLALFGLPVTHEDDAIRAIKAAREIHTMVKQIRPDTIKLAMPLAMHTGINTGLVVTARTTPSDGCFDLSGDAVNTASRLADLARPEEILVGPETYRQAFGFFDFASQPPIQVQGKSRPVSVYTVQGEKSRPMTGQRKLNFTANLIGRRTELNQLVRAMSELEAGTGSIIQIIGEAGTGKSRLLQEFEKEMADKPINWITGYAYAHTQQVPFFPLIGIVRRWLELDGSATAEQMSAGIAQRVGELLGDDAEEIPIIQGLIGQEVEETARMSPDEWRRRLKSAMLNLLSAIAGQALTVFCMEDIHWGDMASFKLLKDIIFNFEKPALVLCTTRPHASLFTSHELDIIASIYSEIHLGDLSPSQIEDMMESMLDTQSLPDELCRLIRKRAEGNPFYLEEILNALVESGALTFSDNRWMMNRAFKEADIPSTIHGIISSRMDQLGATDKRILQEASVIGRAFLYDILKRVSVHGDDVDAGLYKLERAGLIKPRALHPEMEFMFKHALIQEVSYGSLLRSERQRVHERIGRTIERIYRDRLSEFDETLAIHFKKSIATDKAADYLIRSGTKALRRCALDESDQYFKTAKSMLEQQQLATPETKKRLLDVVNQWAFVFYYRGLNRQLLELLEHQLPLVEGLKDSVREGYHWAWHGCALWHRHRFEEAYASLTRALELGQQTRHPYLTAYASTWISWPCTELGRFDEALEHSRRAESLYTQGVVQDAYIYFNGLLSKGYACWHKGDARQTGEIGERLIRFGNRHGNVRSLVSGHCSQGWRDLAVGDLESATRNFQTAVEISADPWYSQFPKLALCYGAISGGSIDTATPLLDELIAFSDTNGAEFVGEPARFFHNLTRILKGEVSQGVEKMEALLDKWQAAGCRLRCLTCGYVMARVYELLFQGAMQTDEGQQSGQAMAARCIHWYRTCLDEAREMGARAMEGQSLLGLGTALQALGQEEDARRMIQESILIFEEVEATSHLQQARAALGPGRQGRNETVT